MTLAEATQSLGSKWRIVLAAVRSLLPPEQEAAAVQVVNLRALTDALTGEATLAVSLSHTREIGSLIWIGYVDQSGKTLEIESFRSGIFAR